MVRLYREIYGGESLVMAGDPSFSNYAAAVVLSRQRKDFPLIFRQKIESPQFGIELFNIGLYLKKKTGEFPLLAVERNIGQATIEKLRNLGYPLDKLYRQKTFDRVTQKEEERIGWTTTTANRRKMLDVFAMDVRNKEFKIYDEDFISEMLTFVVNEKTGEPRPESGSTSDLIMAGAIAVQMLKEVPGHAKWIQQPKDKSRILPEKAEGFINEPFDPDEGRDWRGQ